MRHHMSCESLRAATCCRDRYLGSYRGDLCDRSAVVVALPFAGVHWYINRKSNGDGRA
jgi:hypothetical protein